MRKQTELRPEFVTFAPAVLEPGVLYVSMEYATVLHLCCCGCGNKVVTPLRPGRWRLTFDGEAVWLAPSIGNWSFPCQSHYWIEGNNVVWDRPFSRREIAVVRASDRLAMEGGSPARTRAAPPPPPPPPAEEFRQSRTTAPWWRRWLGLERR